MKGIFHLKGTVKNYEWGGFSFLPRLLHVENLLRKPFAEYWLGTHAGGKTIVDANGGKVLQDLTGSLPYLFKVLDVKEMLSIQVHPSKEAALRGYEDENRAGIAADDPGRLYRDPGEKPELMVAISEFWLLHGFKPEEELHDILMNVTELSELLPVFHNRGYAGLYREVMEMPQPEVNRLLAPLREHLAKEEESETLIRSNEDFWAARAMRAFGRDARIDRGIFSIYFFNLIKLEKGQGVFQQPGVPHAYLEGRNVEIMGNSDNVLRGGLTRKPIAIGELLRHIDCEPVHPAVVLPSGSGAEKVYNAPTNVFRLSSISLSAGEEFAWKAEGNEILVIVEGEARIGSGGKELLLGEGSPSILVSGNVEVGLHANNDCLIFRAKDK